MNQTAESVSPSVPLVELLLEPSGPGPRHLEPVTCGIPWPRGVLRDPARLALHDAQGRPVPLQTRVLDRWSDQSVRWLLLDWQATVDQPTRYTVCHGDGPTAVPPGLRVQEDNKGVRIDTGPAQFTLAAGGAFPFVAAQVAGVDALDAKRSSFTAEDDKGRIYGARIKQVRVDEAGPLRALVRLEGGLVNGAGDTLTDLFAWLHFFAGSSTVRFVLTVRNPRRALHPDGLWDLGDPGSILVRDLALTLALPAGGPATVSCSPEPTAPLTPCAAPLELYQDSSGGDNWRSSNHVNRHHVVPNTFCGYRLRTGGREQTSRRATPVVCLERGPNRLAVAVQYFWQNFPKAIEATPDSLTLRLFPRQYADVHEIQGGEQKTHTFSVAFGPDTVTPEPLAWCREPLLPRATPEWYCATGAVPYLTPKAADPNELYLRLVDAAIEGDDTFAHKREVLDEYGWRHFGDIYGDHEAVRHQGPMPLVSHYNNQYDPIAGFAYQFLRSSDGRWWRHMHELAAHVIDIDIYHTTRDKAAYNGGTFWHTVHYLDADTATHRAYPKAAGVSGGGPAAAQCYNTGLMLHHFLTGDPLSRQTAVELGRWAIDMDDGCKTVFRWLDGGCTGLASASADPLHHGPGRASANTIATLVNAHRLSGDPAFLAKAEQLIRRCIHPTEDLRRHKLDWVEMRWFYTMFLQMLGHYLDYKAERGELDFLYTYARESLLRYARWMAEHECPYLDKPERLEFPTETWAAQDIRKSDIFRFAAKHAVGTEHERFTERAEFFFRYATTTLSGMKTRALARPVVVLLSNGLLHAFFQQNPGVTAPPPREQPQDFGAPEHFVPQKVRAKKRFLALACASLVVAVAGLVYLLCT